MNWLSRLSSFFRIFIQEFWLMVFLALMGVTLLPFFTEIFTNKYYISDDSQAFASILLSIFVALWLSHKITITRLIVIRSISVALVVSTFLYFTAKHSHLITDAQIFKLAGTPLLFIITGIFFFVCLFVRIFCLNITHNDSSVKEYKRIWLYTDENYSVQQESFDDIFKDSYRDISKALLETESKEESFAIGITGFWGEGKTQYVKSFSDFISTSDQCRDFLAFKKPVIIKAEKFCERNIDHILFKHIIHHIEANNPIELYKLGLKELLFTLIFSTNVFSRLIEGLFNISFSNSDSDTSIKNILSKLVVSKKLIVVIDDIERLMPNEIIRILRATKNSIRYPNIRFIFAYDKEHLNRQLESSDYQSLGENYIDKYIQLEIQVSKPKKSLLFAYLLDLLEQSELSKIPLESQEEIIQPIRKIFELEETLKLVEALDTCSINYRDMHRIANDFMMSLCLHIPVNPLH